ncbi:ATP-binding protein [Streptomyces sp. NPDC057287]|uniref:ATP-binding protein n=1 Tax=Streptomyces sp. NPDC057287 TaxID=3346086 RepID=UPI0036340D84
MDNVVAGSRTDVRGSEVKSVRSDSRDGSCGRPSEYLMRAGYPLEDVDGSIATARHHALDFLDGARADHGVLIAARARDLTPLVVSELVTNVRKYAPGPASLELFITVEWIDVVVRDSEAAFPLARTADPCRIGQHGLEIVKAVTTHLFIDQDQAGKRVTARITLTDTPAATTPPTV